MITDTNSLVVTRGKRDGVIVKIQGAKYMVMEDYVTLGGGHTVQCAGDIS